MPAFFNERGNAHRRQLLKFMDLFFAFLISHVVLGDLWKRLVLLG